MIVLLLCGDIIKKTMIFHYISDKEGIALCGRKIEEKYLSDDWGMVDCKRCWGKKDMGKKTVVV